MQDSNPQSPIGPRAASATVFLLCILPALLGTAAVISIYWHRGREAMQEVGHLVCRLKADRADPLEPSASDEKGVGARLTQYLKGHLDLAALEGETGPCYCAAPGAPAPCPPRMMQAKFQLWPTPPGGGSALTSVLFLALLPFATIAGQMARVIAFDARPKADAEARRQEVAKMHRYAGQSLLMKCIVAAVAAWGWIYAFNAHGVAVSNVEDFLQDHQIIGSSSLPLLLSENYKLRPIIAAFIGWYLYFVAYMFYRARRNDVRSARVYGVLLRKLLFALAVGAVLSIDKDSVGATLVALVIGILPLSALQILKEYGAKVGSDTKHAGGALTELPGVSAWEVVRLEEEGVDSLASLLTKPREELRESLPMAKETVDLWYDMAALMTIASLDRYQKLRNVCQSATVFVKRAADPLFQEAVATEAGIKNVSEIAELLHRHFGPGTPADLKP